MEVVAIWERNILRGKEAWKWRVTEKMEESRRKREREAKWKLGKNSKQGKGKGMRKCLRKT